MRKHGIITKRYLQLITSSKPVFKTHPLGATKSLEQTLKSMVDMGMLKEIPGSDLMEKYKYQGKAYCIMS